LDRAIHTRTISHLDELIAGLPIGERQRFERIFHVVTTKGEVVPPESMRGLIGRQFGSVDAVREQRIVKVTNLITLEGSLFNELRASRPMECRMPEDLEAQIAGSAGDPFCRPIEGTPEDVFGRVRGMHAITASNIAKYDGFHGVVVFDEHNPLRFSAEQVADYVDTALAWARQAHSADNEARYFFFMWNCLWRSGASILHGHAQMTLSRGMHYPKVEALRRASLLYRIAHGADYFDDLCDLHESLGLGTRFGTTRAFASLTPVKEKEVLLVSAALDADLKRAIFEVLDAFVTRLGVQSFNLAVYRRPIDSVVEDWSGFPVIVRIVDRGELNNRTADIGAMELYGASVVSSDPFRVAERIAGGR
jgi:hypothetical protein